MTRSAVRLIAVFNDEIAALETALAAGFEQHPDAEIILSLPGLGTILGGRVLGEFGDDPDRYADPKARKNYAGVSPITRASGRSRTVLARYIRNRRLADAVTLWAFCSLTHPWGARRYYDQLRARHKTHQQALASSATAGLASSMAVSHQDPLRRRHRLAHATQHRGLTACAPGCLTRAADRRHRLWWPAGRPSVRMRAWNAR